MLLFLFHSLGIGQNNTEPFSRVLSINDGLPSQVIYDLYASKSGYIYLGTEIGLVRYDGISFKHFPVNETKGNSIDGIKEDDDGRIWCMNFSNQLFYLDDDSLRLERSLTKRIQDSGPLRSFEIINNEFWLVTDKTILVGNSNELVSLDVQVVEDIYNDFNRIHYIKHKNLVYVSDQNTFIGLYPFSKEVIQVISKKYGDAEFTFNDNQIFSINKSSIGSFQSESSNKLPLKNFEKNYTNKLISIDDHIWICTNKGLIQYHVLTERVKRHFFKNIRVTDIVKDFEGGYWVSTIGKGLIYIPNINIILNPLSEYGVNRIITGENNTLFAGSGNGIVYHLNENGDIINKFQSDYFTEIEFLFFEKNFNRLLTSHGIYDLGNNSFSSIRLGKMIQADSLGNYIMNLYNKALILNADLTSPPQNPIFDKVSLSEYAKIPMKVIWNNRTINSFYLKNENAYLIGTAEGLRKIKGNLQYEKILYNGEEIIVSDFEWLNDSTLLLATLQSGILKLKNDDVSLWLDNTTGLTNNTSRKILINNNRLFVNTGSTIEIVDLKTMETSNLSALKSFKNISIADFCTVDNKLLLATSRGIIKIDIPDKIKVNLPKIHSIDFLSLSNQNSNGLVAYSKNNISFLVNAIQYSGLGQYEFQYRLVGLSNEWFTQIALNPIFNFISLPSGNYQFEVRTKLFGEVSETKIMNFVIPTPFWKESWFIFSAVLLILLLLYLTLQIILLKQKKKQTLKESLLTSQMTALRSQMNPHFIYNVLNSLQGLIYSDKKNEASRFISNLSSLMRTTLENSSNLEISIQDEIKTIQVYLELESQRFEDGINYNIENKLNEQDYTETIPSMILQPFIENSIKHGLLHKSGEKKIHLKLDRNAKNQIEINIIDNGIGRKRSQEINAKRKNHKPFATDAINTRVKIMNQLKPGILSYSITDLEDSNGNALGTKVKVIINKTETDY